MSLAPPIPIGITSTSFIPTPGARLSSTIRPELAKSRKPFTCFTLEAATLMPSLYSADPLNRGLFYTEFEKTDKEGLLSEVEMISEGLLNNVLPQPFYKNNFCIQSVTSQATAASTGDKVSISVRYRAPSTSYEWIENVKPPDYPRYSAMMTSASPLDIKNIEQITLTTDQGVGAWIPYSDFVSAWNSLAVQLQITEYEPEEVIPGLYWKCRSTSALIAIGSTGS